MMHNRQPYSFEKTDVRGRFLLNFSCTKVQSKDVSPIAGNEPGVCEVAVKNINFIKMKNKQMMKLLDGLTKSQKKLAMERVRFFKSLGVAVPYGMIRDFVISKVR